MAEMPFGLFVRSVDTAEGYLSCVHYCGARLCFEPFGKLAQGLRKISELFG